MTTLPVSRDVKVAIVGCGTIADRYAPGVVDADGLELLATTDLDTERAEELASAHGASAYDDLDTLLRGSDAPLVVNLTSHTAHAPVTKQCLEAGRHVYSEKPLAMDAAEAQELVDLAEEQGLGLGCAPISLAGDAQQCAWRYLRENRLGTVRTAYADCNIGRLTEWNESPEGFLRAGPLYDGAVYPLSVLVGYFGPVVEIETAHSELLLGEHEHEGCSFAVETPDHVICVLRFADGLSVRLTASMYVPHRTRSFYDLEIHGDEGSLHLADAAAFDSDGRVAFARLGREYRTVPSQRPLRDLTYASGVVEMAVAIEEGRGNYLDGARAAHLVEVVEAIERRADANEPVAVDSAGFERPEPLENDRFRASSSAVFGAAAGQGDGTEGGAREEGLSMPPVGFGCSRYRGGDEYVDLRESIEVALDAGYRLLDCAELYGNERRIGEILARPGSPDREALFLLSKVWNTNHAPEHLRAACDRSRKALGVETLDCYMLHWPDAWEHQGPLEDLAESSHTDATALTFPTDEAGDPLEADVTLAESWRAMESLVEAGKTRTLGVSNFSVAELEELLEVAEIPPRIVQVGRDPYTPREELLAFCAERGIEVMAHSPLSAEGLLDEPVLREIAADHGVTPAQVLVRWNLESGTIPIPSSTSAEHAIENADVFVFSLTETDHDRIATLEGTG
ncbi:alcohol dehydrogenase [Halobacteriales archaeon QH_8_64_26]|nr:MAG: alcohol dehydrogenase [Halobacteriales archaeon QH_8_64_26]